MTTRQQQKNDLKDQTFGKLTVVSIGRHVMGIGYKSMCQCVCGRREEFWNHHLLKGRKKACQNCLTPSQSSSS